MADDIVVGSVAVDVVPDTRNFRRDLNAKLQGINVDIGVNADTSGVRADLDDLTRTRNVKVNTKADVAAAETKLDRTARDRTARIKTRVESGDLFKAASGFGALTSAALVLGPSLVPILATVGAIGFALAAPLAVAAGGATVFGFLTGAVIKQTEDQKKKIDQLKKAVDSARQSLANTQASAATAAANSLATAHASAAASLKSAQTSAAASLKSARQAEATATTAAGRAAARRRVAAAQATLDARKAAINTSLSARQAAIQRSQSASVEAAQRKVTQAVAAYHAALKGLTPAQKRFLDAQHDLKGAFEDLIQTSGPMILGPVTQALKTLTGILPDISPLISSVSGALTDLLTDLGDSVKSPGFKAFVATFSRQVGPDIVQFGHIAGQAVKGFTGLVLGLGDAFGPSVLRGLGSLVGKFAAFGGQVQNSKKLQDFVDYFHRVGPQVGQTIGAVARAVGHFVEALAPLGPPVLKVVEGIANQISSIPIPVLTAMAGAFGALVLASKASKGLSALSLFSRGGVLGGSGGGLAGVRSSILKPVHVWVDNPGFGGGADGGGKGAPVVTGAGAAAEAAAREAEAVKAAKAAAEAVKAAGGDVAAQSSAAARAFKEALNVRDAATLKEILDFGIKGGAGGLLRTILAAPAGITLGDQGNEVLKPGEIQLNGQDFLAALKAGRVKKSEELDPDVLKLFNLTPSDARGLLGIPEIRSTTDHVDALQASLGKASRTIDQIGPHADNAFGAASKDVADFSAKLDAVHDKEIRVILNDLAAVQALKALQAFRLKDKTLNINEVERQVGPGGGIGHPLPNASDFHTRSCGGGSGGGGALVHIQNANISDTNDLLRKAQDSLISRAGGGVLLRPPPTTRFPS